ncbi:hypothetical protein [Vibrio intestinalis]|uniref:hypothetical protein n=1 Tax=Vibrio intestinalis TaxID=2933291 RepID=UPI0021A8759F|nr:hypothetical protein [Vibrio intestinalis]
MSALALAVKQLQPQIDISDIGHPVCSKLKSDFRENTWTLELDGKEFDLSFDVILDTNVYLIEDEDLLNSVKWLVLLSINENKATKSALSTQKTIEKYFGKVLYFIRAMRLQGISNPKNATQRMVDDFTEGFKHTVGHNLDFLGRYMKLAESTDFRKYAYIRETDSTSPWVEFSLSEMLAGAGIPVNIWRRYSELSQISESLISKYETRGRSSNGGEKQSSLHAINTEGTVQKEISALNRTLRLAKRFPDLVTCFPNDVAVISNARGRILKAEAAKSGKTADVPFHVMKNTIERSIEFVMHYGKLLIEKRDEAVQQFEDLCASKPSQNRSDLAKEFFRKNPIILNGFEHTKTIKVTNFQRTVYKKADEAKKALMEKAAKLHDDGESMANIATEFKTTTGTISRWIRDHNDPFGNDSRNHGFTTICYHLMVAIEMILCFFTARRSAEVTSLKAGCMSTTESGHWIQMYVAKTYRVNDNFTATNLIKVCIEILEELTLPSRLQNDDESLFQMQRFIGKDEKPFKYEFKDQKSQYLEFIGISDEYNWNFSEHQFRRFFSVVFVNHFGGSMNALKYHLRHTDVAMTFEYIKRESGADTASADRRAAMVEVTAEQHRKNGRFDRSTSIGKEFDDCAQAITSMHPKRVEKSYARVIEDNDIVFEMTEDGLCVGNTKKYRDASKCIKGDELAHTFKACSEFCDGCPNLLRLDNWKFRNVDDQCLLNPESSPIFQAAVAQR